MSSPDAARPPRIEVIGITGIGEVTSGNDLADLLLDALIATGQRLSDSDVVVVSSKIVSKAEGRTRTTRTRDAAVEAETVRVVAERMTPRGRAAIVQTTSGPVLAAAGVDTSNVAQGTVLVLPADPDRSARTLRARLREATGARIGVVITDTLGRPWRQGQTDAAVGAAGIVVTEDLRGGIDSYGNVLDVTVRAVADEIAALADLVKGKLNRVPVAVLRGAIGLVTDDDGPGAVALLRPSDQDWFRYGHAEAVRTALGAPPGTPEVPLRPIEPGTAGQRLARAAAVTLASGDGAVAIEVTGATLAAAEPDTDRAQARLTIPGPSATALVTLGLAAQRLLTAAWAEDLLAEVGPLDVTPDSGQLLIHAGKAHRV